MTEYNRNNLVDFCEKSTIAVAKQSSELCYKRDKLTYKNKDRRYNYDADLLLVNHDLRVLRMLSDVLDRARDNLERNTPTIDCVYFTLMTTIDYAYQALNGWDNIRNISDNFYLLNATPYAFSLGADTPYYRGLILKSQIKYKALNKHDASKRCAEIDFDRSLKLQCKCERANFNECNCCSCNCCSSKCCSSKCCSSKCCSCKCCSSKCCSCKCCSCKCDR